MREGDYLWGWLWPPWWLVRPNFRVFRTCLVLAIFVLGMVSIPAAHATPTLVSGHDGNTGLTTTVQAPFAGPGNPKSSFMAKGLYWLFYASGFCFYLNSTASDGCLLFSTSSDGITWSAPTNTSFAAKPNGFVMDQNGTQVFLATSPYTNLGQANIAVLFRYGTLGAGTVSWSAVSVIPNTNSSSVDDLKLSSKNAVFVSFNKGNLFEIAHSSDLTTWTTDVNVGGPWLTKLASPAGAIYAVTSQNGIVNGTFWNNGWSNPETVYTGSGSSTPRTVGAVYGDSSGNVYLFVRDSVTLNLIFAIRNTQGVWSNNVIASTSTSQQYVVSYAPNLSVFSAVIFQSGEWLWFTLSVTGTSQFVQSQTQTLAMTGNFTVNINGVTDDYLFSVAPNNLFSPAQGLGDVSDFYWTTGTASPFTINSAQMLLTPSGGSCFLSVGGCSNSPVTPQALPLTVVVVQLFASLFFGSVAGMIVLAATVLFFGLGVYSYERRRSRRREKPRFSLDNPVKDRKKRVEL